MNKLNKQDIKYVFTEMQTALFKDTELIDIIEFQEFLKESADNLNWLVMVQKYINKLENK